MAWAFDDYIVQNTVKDQSSRLRLHMQEVSAAITAKMMSDGTAIDPKVLQEYRKDLTVELNKLKGGGAKLTIGVVFKL